MSDRLKLLLSGISLCAYGLGLQALAQGPPSCKPQPFADVTIEPRFELNGQGKNIDTIAFWVAPDVTDNLMFATAKNNFLVEVWKYPFVNNEQPPLTHATFSNSIVNGVLVDQDMNLLYVASGVNSSTVTVFQLPQLDYLTNFSKKGANLKSEPNLALLTLTNGDKRIYVSADDIVFVHDATTGDFLFEFTPSNGLETMTGDNFHQILYIPDENGKTGVYVYDPDGRPFNMDGTNNFGGTEFQSDAEGILVFACPGDGLSDDGTGFIVVSDQRADQTEFEVFDRKSWSHLGTFKISGVSNTDGIASCQRALPDYPMGLFVAVNDDHTLVGVGWDEILVAIGLTTDLEENQDAEGPFFKTDSALRSYPNPFNTSTIIDYEIPRDSRVKIVIYNNLGEEVRTLVENQKQAGRYQVVWDGDNDAGLPVSTGTYLIHVRADGLNQIGKMVLLR